MCVLSEARMCVLSEVSIFVCALGVHSCTVRAVQVSLF